MNQIDQSKPNFEENLTKNQKIKPIRKFYINTFFFSNFSQTEQFVSNVVSTSKYTLLNFLPLALLYQYANFFNIFVLINTIISCIKQLSTVSPISAIVPFILVTIINLIKEGLEDYKKHKNDYEANNTKTTLFKSPNFIDSKWSEIKVGNILKINKEDIIPSDILVIKSSNENGFCYMQTTNIDGETNLKPIEAIKKTNEIINEDLHNMDKLFDFQNENCKIEVDNPNSFIYEINGILFLNKDEKNIFDIKNVLLRGSRLKNVDYVYGIVLYTGNDTKILQNINHFSLKLSSVDKSINKVIIFIFVMRMFLIFIFMILQIYFRLKHLPNYEKNELKWDYIFVYFDGKKKNVFEGLKAFTSLFILTGSFLPISVIIMNHVIKAFQVFYIERCDENLQKEKGDKVKSLSNTLLEDLGMVKYILSDKTGTITKNELTFKACSIFTALFDDEEDENLSEKLSVSENITTSVNSKFEKSFNKTNLINRLILKDIPLEIKDMQGCDFNNQNEAIEQFLFNICINHDCIKEKEKFEYQGNSPDEVTLLSASNELGYSFISRENGIITIEIRNLQNEKKRTRKFEILNKFDFTSARQRSSIIVRDEFNLIFMYMKGSDTKIFQNLNEYSIKNVLSRTKEHADNFSKRGLRTLCYSFKRIDEIYYKKWKKNYENLKYEVIKNKNLEKNLMNIIEEIEKDQTLLGVTALEDKLQDNVREDINSFIEAGINILMITGDKMDTAESIGYSCKLLDDDTEVFKIKETREVNKVVERMEKIKEKIKDLQNYLDNINNPNYNKVIDKDENFNNDEESNNQEKIYNSVNLDLNYRNFNFDNEILFEENEINSNYFYSKRNKLSKKNDNKKIKKHERKDSFISNTSILKFMIDNEQLKNNDIEYENLSIIKNNIQRPSFNKTEEFNFNNKPSIIINNSNNNINNEDNISSFKSNEIFNFTIDNLSIPDERNYIPHLYENNNNNENNIKYKKIKNKNENENEKIIFTNDIKLELNKEKDKQNINNENDNKNKNENENNINSNLKTKLTNREKVALPLSNNKFQLYFEKCQKYLSLLNNLDNYIPCLFKLPYIYGKTLNNKNSSSYSLKVKYSLIIQGDSIQTCMNEGQAQKLFWELILNCRSLICCRCSPLQKSKIVEFIKKNTNDIILAIGDGENDVNMIKTANVGIGLFGKEGYQAAYNADYAISQFKYLKRLLFVHGRFTILRNSYFMYQFFFRNILYNGPLLLSLFYNGFSGAFYYDDYYHTAYNSFILILPLLIYAIFEEDINIEFNDYNKKDEKTLKYLLPDIYAETRDSLPFSTLKFIIIFIVGFIISFPLFFFSFYDLKYGIKGENGEVYGVLEAGSIIYFNCFLFHCVNMFIDTHYYNWPIYSFYIFQIILDIIFFIVYEKMNLGNMLSGNLFNILDSLHYWLLLLLELIILSLPFYLLRKFEFFFGGFIINRIKINKYDDNNSKKEDKYKLYLPLYLKKFYKKKLEQISCAIKSVTKFKRIYQDIKKNKENIAKKPSNEEENIVDQKMRKNVEEYIIYKKKLSKKIK